MSNQKGLPNVKQSDERYLTTGERLTQNNAMNATATHTVYRKQDLMDVFDVATPGGVTQHIKRHLPELPEYDLHDPAGRPVAWSEAAWGRVLEYVGSTPIIDRRRRCHRAPID